MWPVPTQPQAKLFLLQLADLAVGTQGANTDGGCMGSGRLIVGFQSFGGGSERLWCVGVGAERCAAPSAMDFGALVPVTVLQCI